MSVLRAERERECVLREKKTDSKSVKNCVNVFVVWCDAMVKQKKGLLAGGLPIMSSRL